MSARRTPAVAVTGVVLALALGSAPARSTATGAEPGEALAESSLPDGLSVVALFGDEWRVLVAADGRLSALENVPHPRSVAWHHGSGQLAWVGADNRLRLTKTGTGDTVELPIEADRREHDRYTQPAFSPDGAWLYAVELPGGRSRSTNLVGFELPGGTRHHLVRKRTAQFEPHVGDGRTLHYTTAICVDDCAGMIWELWERDLPSGRHRQLTLMNAVANQPRLGTDGWLYFTSDAAGGGFHLWRARPVPGAEPERLTAGAVRDSDPSPVPDGSVYFLRKIPAGTRLMRLADGVATPVALDPEIRDLRDLEAGP